MEHTEKLIIEGINNHWKIPSGEGVIHLEGKPSEERRLENVRRTAEKRLTWKPGAEAMAIYRSLKSLERDPVIIQLWDDIMLVLYDEDPLPFKGQLKNVTLEVVREDNRDFEQLFVEITGAQDIPSRYSGNNCSSLPKGVYNIEKKTHTFNCSLIYIISES